MSTKIIIKENKEGRNLFLLNKEIINSISSEDFLFIGTTKPIDLNKINYISTIEKSGNFNIFSGMSDSELIFLFVKLFKEEATSHISTTLLNLVFRVMNELDIEEKGLDYLAVLLTPHRLSYALKTIRDNDLIKEVNYFLMEESDYYFPLFERLSSFIYKLHKLNAGDRFNKNDINPFLKKETVYFHTDSPLFKELLITMIVEFKYPNKVIVQDIKKNITLDTVKLIGNLNNSIFLTSHESLFLDEKSSEENITYGKLLHRIEDKIYISE